MMKNIIYIAITYLICAAFAMGRIWAAFTGVLLVLILFKISPSLLWEIPMGVLSCSIIADLFSSEIPATVRILVPIAAAFTAFSAPRKLPIVFLLAIFALVLKDVYAISTMWAVLWYAGRTLLIKRQGLLYNSSIKKDSLQGNNFKQ